MESLKSRAKVEIAKLPEKDIEMVAKKEVVATVIEPSSEEIRNIVTQFTLGKSNVEIQRLVMRQDTEGFLCFSLEQIETVRQAWSEVFSQRNQLKTAEDIVDFGETSEDIR